MSPRCSAGSGPPDPASCRTGSTSSTPPAARPLVEEVTHLAGHHEELHLHLIDTQVSPRLTVDQILATVGAPIELSAFLCGPESMVNTLQKSLVKEGVKAANVHREYYNLR